MTACVVALDVGGTAMKAAIVDEQYRMLASSKVPTRREAGPDAVVERIVGTVADLRGAARERGWDVRAAGVVVPGVVDERRGIAVFSSNIGWRDVPLVEQLTARLDVPVAFGHDVRAGGLAEGALGAARGASDYLFLPIGTGIAGAVVLNGEAYSGHGYAGEIGHIVLDPDGAPCGCGARGCLETIASASGIAARYAERTGHRVEALEISTRVLGGDPDATAVWDAAVTALAGVLGGYTSVLAPDVVVVGGGLATARDTLIDPLERALDRRLSFQHRPKLVLAELADQAGALGAALLAWRVGHR